MELLKLAVAFIIILVFLKYRRPLWNGVVVACIALFFLYGIAPMTAVNLTVGALTAPATIEIVFIIYLITFLQILLENRGKLSAAEQALSGLFNNRRVNACGAPIFIGLMPAPSAVVIAAPIVDKACGDYLDKNEKTFLTSFYRHVPESSMPTYSSVLIACQLTGVALSSFMIGMIPMVVALIMIPYFVYLRKVPKDTGLPPSQDKKKEVKTIFTSLWSIIAIIAVVIFLQQAGQFIPGFSALPAFVPTVWFVALIVLVLFIIIHKVPWAELKPLFIKAFHPHMILASVTIMVFKDIVSHTGVIEQLPAMFSGLPIPEFLVYGLIMFFGSIVSGQLAILAIIVPMAFAVIPGAGMPLLVMFMCFGHAAMQLSPTHVCLALATQYFGTSMKDLLVKTIPVVLIFLPIVVAYYLLLSMIF